jgi:hypothetical protein
MADFYPTNEQNLTHTPQLSPAEEQRQQRIDTLMELLFIKHIGMKQACKEIGISRTTGYEYFRIWQDTEEAQLIDTEFWILYQQVKQDDPAKALEILSRIKVKQITLKAEIREEHIETRTVNYNLNYSEEDKTAILNARRAILNRRSSTPEPISLH